MTIEQFRERMTTGEPIIGGSDLFVGGVPAKVIKMIE